MKRREFITLVAGTAATLPLAARAQNAGRVYRLGFLIPAARGSAAVDATFDELRRSGFVEGQNLAVIGRFGLATEQLADAVSAVVTAAPDAIVAGPELYARALQGSTRTVPLISISAVTPHGSRSQVTCIDILHM